jgi:predicted DCC family thiol-disulfide oxidoreductase YuxK
MVDLLPILTEAGLTRRLLGGAVLYSRRWKTHVTISAMEKNDQPIIFFDGVCNLCNNFVDLIMSIDEQHIFRFASLQGETAKKLLAPQDYNNMNSVVLYTPKKVLKKSTAVIEILKSLGGGWKAAGVFGALPASVTDVLYDMTAKYRYKIFGKKDTCRIPTKEERALFLD